MATWGQLVPPLLISVIKFYLSTDFCDKLKKFERIWHIHFLALSRHDHFDKFMRFE